LWQSYFESSSRRDRNIFHQALNIATLRRTAAGIQARREQLDTAELLSVSEVVA
jgi:hypothetical protein